MRPSQDRFGEHSSELDSITHALAELSTPESALHDGLGPRRGAGGQGEAHEHDPAVAGGRGRAGGCNAPA